MADQIYNLELFKSRSVLGRLFAAFRFVNNNLRVFLKLGTYLLLPMVVILALYNVLFITGLQDKTSAGYWIVTIISFLILIAGTCCFNSLIYTLFYKYARSGSLPEYRLKDLKQALIVNAKKIFLYGLVIFVIGTLCGILILLLLSLSPYTLILTIPLALFVLLPFSYTPFVYILEETSLINAIIKSFKLGIPTWGAIFAVRFISSFIVFIIQLIVCLPWLMGLMVNSYATIAVMSGETVVLPGFFPLLMFFLVTISLFISYLTKVLIISAMAFQYGSAETKRKELLMEDNQSL